MAAGRRQGRGCNGRRDADVRAAAGGREVRRLRARRDLRLGLGWLEPQQHVGGRRPRSDEDAQAEELERHLPQNVLMPVVVTGASGLIGVAAVTGLSQAAADKLAATADVQSVQPDRVVTLKPDGIDDGGASMELTPSETLAAADATASPTAAQFYARQWNMRAVFADQAWAAGHRGSRDVVVALLDSGLDYTLPDFAGLVDVGRSIMQDRRQHSQKVVPPGQGDRGDQKRRS